MIAAENVTFRTIDAEVQDLKTGDDRKTMDVVEITYPDGKVVAFPVDQVSPEDGRKYSEIYADKYKTFKAGNPDPDHVDRLNREIADRQAELKGLHGRRPQGDERVQENLGYGKKTDPKEDPHSTSKREDKTPAKRKAHV